MTANLNFTGKSVFVVGGTSGINYGIAQGFARWGAKVAVASRKQDKVDTAVQGLKDLGAEAAGFTFDVRKFDDVSQGFSDAAQFFGGSIDVLVSGAAGNFPARLTDTLFGRSENIDPLAVFDTTVALEILATFAGAWVLSIEKSKVVDGSTEIWSTTSGVVVVLAFRAIALDRDERWIVVDDVYRP